MKKPAAKAPAITTALSADALMGKSQAYIGRALVAKAAGSMGEYQLWASLALELVGIRRRWRRFTRASWPIRTARFRFLPQPA
jgi:hypothetical protein